MVQLGYKLSSEEFGARALVDNARRAEETGFTFALISDHFHPWVDAQGQSPFVWAVLGGIAQATERLRVGTAVTCPTVRIHPAILAQAAATTASLFNGRFMFGVGTGENLNEHIVAQRWPSTDVRQDMLEEAIQVIRTLWEGGLKSHCGRHYAVENARLYSLPKEPPPLFVAGGGPKSAEIAGRLGDGLIGTSPDPETMKAFERAGGRRKPRYGELTVCWAESEAKAKKIARKVWPTAVLASALHWELPLPSNFEAASEDATEDQVAEEIVCGPDPDRHLEKIREYAKGGFDHVCVHQVGPDQEGFFRFYAREILPKLGAKPARMTKVKRAA
jgi:coenzyme F420-dependent glucose-6-phosphate dehydrogenase